MTIIVFGVFIIVGLHPQVSSPGFLASAWVLGTVVSKPLKSSLSEKCFPFWAVCGFASNKTSSWPGSSYKVVASSSSVQTGIQNLWKVEKAARGPGFRSGCETRGKLLTSWIFQTCKMEG